MMVAFDDIALGEAQELEQGWFFPLRSTQRMPDRERWERLEKLTCVFPALNLYFDIELLEEALRRRGVALPSLLRAALILQCLEIKMALASTHAGGRGRRFGEAFTALAAVRRHRLEPVERFFHRSKQFRATRRLPGEPPEYRSRDAGVDMGGRSSR